MNSKKVKKQISDLGMAAYIKIHGFRCVGRKGKNYYFEADEKDCDQFDQLTVDYINSPMHDFDSALMSLKKIGEYLGE